MAVAAKGKKKKFKKVSKGGTKLQDVEKDMSKVKCFACQNLGIVLDNAQTRRKNNRQQLQQRLMSMLLDLREFSLFAGGGRERASSITSKDIEDQTEHSMIVRHPLSASTTSSTWYIDSGASSHMTGDHDMFVDMTESDWSWRLYWEITQW